MIANSDSGRRRVVHLALLAALTLGVYADTLRNTFFLDDHYYILGNAHIRSVQPIGRHFTDPTTMSSIRSNVLYRPLLPLSLSLTYALHGYDVLGYHVFNIAFQALAAIFVYLLLAELLSLVRARAPSVPRPAPTGEIPLVAAAIFAIHPLSGFVVNYPCSRDNLMMLTFLLAALYLWARMRRTRGSPLNWIPVLGLLALSLLAKPNAVVSPALVLALEVLVLGAKWRSPRLWARIAPFAAVVGAFLALRYHVLTEIDQPAWGTSDDAGLGARATYLLTQLKTHLFHYLRNFAWPFRVRALPAVEPGTSADPRVWLGAVAILASLAAAWIARRRSPLISFGIASYWLMFSLTSSVLPTYGIVADRWMYPSMPFISLVVACLVYRQMPLRGARLAAGLLVLYFGAGSLYMNGHYRDDCAVWTHAVRHGTTATGHVNLGRCYMARNDDRAKQCFEKALQIFPRAYIAEINLGVWHLNRGEHERGLELTRRAVAHAPEANRGLAHHWLAKALARTGRSAEALVEARTAAELNPHNVEYLYGAAYLAQDAGEWSAALGLLDRIHGSQDNYELSRFIAGWCLQQLGRLDEAISQYQLAIEHTPTYSQTYLNLGYAHRDRGDCRGAIRAFERYLELQPGNVDARDRIRECRARLGR
jgi:Flp pilus assembly protein TadD